MTVTGIGVPEAATGEEGAGTTEDEEAGEEVLEEAGEVMVEEEVVEEVEGMGEEGAAAEEAGTATWVSLMSSLLPPLGLFLKILNILYSIGEVGDVQSMLRGAGMLDSDIVTVIDPPASQRDRGFPIQTRRNPPVEAWRHETSIGRPLNKNTCIRANHFLVNKNTIQPTMYQYHIHVYPSLPDGTPDEKDVAGKRDEDDGDNRQEDIRILTSLLQRLKGNHGDWEAGGLSYDGKTTLFSGVELPLPSKDDRGQSTHMEAVALPNLDGSDSRRVYFVKLTHIATLNTAVIDEAVMRALDATLFSFARWMVADPQPEWHIVGSKLYNVTENSSSLGRGYEARKGYYASLKMCTGGLMLVSDMSVSCFLIGGNMLEVMAVAGGFRDQAEMLRSCEQNKGLHPRVAAQITDVLKNAKCRLLHLGHSKKIKELSFLPGDRSTEFNHNGTMVTVAEYYESMVSTNPNYAIAIGANGRLLNPYVPTVNVGSKKRPNLIPAHMVYVIGGQSRTKKMTGEMTAQIIRQAAVRPDERFKFLLGEATRGTSVVGLLKNSPATATIGLNNIDPQLLTVPARLLPPAKIRYLGDRGGQSIVDPQLNGAWNMGPRDKFVVAPPLPLDGRYMYGVVMVSDSRPQSNFGSLIADFCRRLGALKQLS